MNRDVSHERVIVTALSSFKLYSIASAQTYYLHFGKDIMNFAVLSICQYYSIGVLVVPHWSKW